MVIDDDVVHWLDEAGELPVKAEDTFSDIDLGSTIGDITTPEHDRQQDTAAWAREAAASNSYRIKEEPEDYPSPMATEPDDQHVVLCRGSRESSSSSRSSGLPPLGTDAETALRLVLEEVVVGPESVTMEELDGWMPPSSSRTDKTSQRARHARSKNHSQRCSGNWGGIGVGNPVEPVIAKAVPSPSIPLTRTRSMRLSNHRRRRSSPCPSYVQTPTPTPTDEMNVELEVTELDAIGTEDLEQARLEAEAKEERLRKACKERAERQKAFLAAYRQKVMESRDVTSPD